MVEFGRTRNPNPSFPAEQAMKLVTFVFENRTRLGALVGREGGERVLDLHQLDPQLPSDIIAFLEAGPAAIERAGAAIAAAGPGDGVPLEKVTLKAPVPRPSKIICIGQNYLAHAQESSATAPPFPIIFSKYANTGIGPGEPIIIPPVVMQPDYEGELAVVIGRRGRDIPEAEALDYVAGYMPLNDVSARDWQMRTSQWTLGKTADTFCPMGPALVTVDEVPDVQNLALRTIVSGEVLQEGHTSQMIFTVAHLIADMSQVMTLDPGDVLATGTPSGVGMARKPPRWLRDGDLVRIEIEGVGALENTVRIARVAA
jgi:2-keto-4-pentenoate hydratase/2-oxohepta-3-ene-1,7-dioic acid hydratase in catechol pathway